MTPNDYLTEEELCVEAKLVLCPFCGKPPSLRARDILHQDGLDERTQQYNRSWMERALYVTCCGATLLLETWQSMVVCERTGWSR